LSFQCSFLDWALNFSEFSFDCSNSCFNWFRFSLLIHN
jgi:hypothetical protein